MVVAWKKIKSKIAHKNPWYSVREDDVIRPDGKPGKYFVVDTIDSVVVIPVDSDGKIYCVCQTRYPAGNKKSWESPSGAIPKNKTPLFAAKMELEEEAGLKAKKWSRIGYFHTAIGFCSEKCYVFLAQDLIKTKAHPEATEDIILKKKSLNEIMKMIKSDKITDSLLISGIYKYILKTKKGSMGF